MLSDSERNVLRALERATVQHRNPSMAEIREFTKPTLSLTSVRANLMRLANKGYVEVSVRRARSIKQLQPTPFKKKGAK